jgi:hypothetical protein
MGPSSAEETQNRGNEAKNSLKTNEVAQTMCAEPTHSCEENGPKRSEETGDSTQSPPVDGPDSVPGRRGKCTGAALYGPGRVDTRAPLEETDIVTESPFDLQT